MKRCLIAQSKKNGRKLGKVKNSAQRDENRKNKKEEGKKERRKKKKEINYV